jgi:hypothetical protein
MLSIELVNLISNKTSSGQKQQGQTNKQPNNQTSKQANKFSNLKYRIWFVESPIAANRKPSVHSLAEHLGPELLHHQLKPLGQPVMQTAHNAGAACAKHEHIRKCYEDAKANAKSHQGIEIKKTKHYWAFDCGLVGGCWLVG